MNVDLVYGLSRVRATILSLFDPGSNTSLILNKLAKLLGRPVRIRINTVNGPEVRDTQLYVVELLNKNNERRLVCTYGVDRISDKVLEVDFGSAKQQFSQKTQENWAAITDQPHGKPVELLIGSEKARLMPTKIESCGDLVVLQSEFGIGYSIYGHHDKLNGSRTTLTTEVQLIKERVTVNKMEIINEGQAKVHPVVDNLGPNKKCVVEEDRVPSRGTGGEVRNHPAAKYVPS